MAVPVVNIQVEQGSDFSATYNITGSNGTPLDLTNHSLTAKMSKYAGGQPAAGFGVTFGATPSDGKITISLPCTASGIITSGRYNYDVLVTSDITGKVTKVISGQAQVNATVSGT